MLNLALILMSENLFFLVMLIMFIYLGFTKNHLLPSFAFLFGWAVTLILFTPLLFKYKKYFIKNQLKQAEKKVLSKQLSFFAFASFFISLGNLVIGYIDTMILTYFRPLSEVGIYNVVLPTVIIIGFFSRSISQVFFPMVSELWAKNLKVKIVEGVNLLHKYTLITVIPISMVLFLYPGLILNLLFGVEYIPGAFAMRILSVGIIFFTVGMIDQSVISGIGTPKVVTNILLVAAAFNIITNFIFIPKWGINGAAITTTLSYILIALLTSIYLRKFIKARSHIAIWLESLFVALVFVISVYVLKYLLNLNPYIEAIICLSIGGII